MEVVSEEPKLHNVKFHFYLPNSKKLLHNNPEWAENSYSWGNYFTYRLNQSKTVYSIFPKAGFVNITGVCSFNDIPQALDEFNRQFFTKINVDEIIVDNSTASGTIEICDRAQKVHRTISSKKLRLDLWRVKKLVSQCSKYQNARISLYPKYFPAAVIRSKLAPTVLLFASGKYTIVGAKSVEKIRAAHQQICAIIQDALMTFPQAIAFAQNVG